MKSYVCKSCGYSWQSANPALECAKFGCGSRLIAEASQPINGQTMSRAGSSRSIISAVPSYVGELPLVSDTAFRVLNVIALVFFIIGALIALTAVMSGEDNGLAVAGGFFGVGALPFSAAYIIFLTHLHRAWKTVQSAAGLGRGLTIPTPGKAVGFLFIPLFNLYWLFIAFKGLMDAANALREDRHILGNPFCAGIATVFAVVEIVGCFLPPLMALTGIAACVLLFPIERDVVRIINTLR